MMKNSFLPFHKAVQKSGRHAPRKRSFLRGTPHKLSIIEVLMIVSLLFVLGTLSIVTMNPSNAFAEARNAERWSHVNALHNSLSEYQRTLRDGLLRGATGTASEICRPHIDAALCHEAGFVSLSHLIPAYLKEIPIDPLAEGMGSGYAVSALGNGDIMVTALFAEKGDIITVGR